MGAARGGCDSSGGASGSGSHGDPEGRSTGRAYQCPVCTAALRREADAVVLRCPNSQGCPAQLVAGLQHFAQRTAMDIDGLGEKLASALVETGLLKDVADLYHLDLPAVAGLPRMAEKSAQNLIDGIAASKRRPLASDLRPRHSRGGGGHGGDPGGGLSPPCRR